MLLCDASERDTQRDSEKAFFRLLVREPRRGGFLLEANKAFTILWLRCRSGLSYRRESASDCIPHTRRLKSIFLARSGRNKSGTIHHAVQSVSPRVGTAGLDCSRFNTLCNPTCITAGVYYCSSLKVFLRMESIEIFCKTAVREVNFFNVYSCDSEYRI